jgi:DNA-binding transcriptional LysR family regulator
MAARDALESDALRAFAVFAAHANFTSAAAELHLSQPSLHAKITKLAARLGVDLYERQGRGLVLTAAGHRLAVLARDSARQVDDFLAELRADDGPVTLTAGRGAFRWVIGAGIRGLADSGRRLHLLVADRGTALASVLDGRADIAVLAHDRPPDPLRAHELASYAQTLVVPGDHRLARRGSARLADLEGLDLVVPPIGRVHRRNLEHALRDGGVSWRVGAEVDGWDLLLHFVSLGMGAAVVNGCVEPPAGLVSLPVTDLPPVRYWAAWRPHRGHIADAVVPALTPAPQAARRPR